MNRKSFYYHFKDKYDLVNWIFDTEIVNIVHDKVYENTWDAMLELCGYFYINRSFYRRALCITGQNSFTEHFQKLLFTVVRSRLRDTLDEEEVIEFQVNFITDAVVMAFQRWIVDNAEMSPEEFINQIKLSIKYIAIRYGDILTKL